MSNLPEIVWATDMDRTLLDTERTFDVFAITCEAEEIVSVEAIHAAKTAVEDSAGSFDVMSYLREEHAVNETAMTDLYQSFIDRARTVDLLYPDARPYLDRVAGHQIIVTYGGEEWQTAKILGSGLGHLPYLVTPFKHKGEMIASWYQDDHYEVTATNGEVVTGKTAYLVDDKAASFNGLPDDCGGYLLERPGSKKLKSQTGSKPLQVEVVATLAGISIPIHIARDVVQL